jgi:hypothetical protein
MGGETFSSVLRLERCELVFVGSVAAMRGRGVFSFLKARSGHSSNGRPLDVAPIAFVHMPKSSGMALIKGLIQARKPALFVQGFDRSVFGSFADFATMDDEIRANVHLDGTSMPPDAELSRVTSLCRQSAKDILTLEQ